MHPCDRRAHRRRTGLLLPEDEPHRLQARRMPFECGGHRPLDSRGWVRLHQPQHPDPFLVGLARVLGQLGPHLLPHRRQPPVGKRRRLGHRPVLAFQQRQHVERIKDLRAPAEHSAMLRHHLGADGDRHPVVVQLHPHRPVGVADRHRVGDVVHAGRVRTCRPPARRRGRWREDARATPADAAAPAPRLPAPSARRRGGATAGRPPTR